MGRAITLLPSAGAELIDTAHAVEVELFNDEMWLESRDDMLVAAGANAALIGDEIVQFGVAEPIGPRRFRLSRLLRGRRGTEWASGTHRIDESFLLLDADRIARVALPLSSLGGRATIRAIGLDDVVPAEADTVVSGGALCPPPPVHLTADHHSEGLRISWIRRSRIGWTWSSGLDTPLGEETERYRVTVTAPGLARSATVDRPEWTYSTADQTADGTPASVDIRVEQIGNLAVSAAAKMAFDLRS